MYVYICMTCMYVYIPSFQSPHGPSAVASASLKSHGFLAVTAQKGKALSELKSHLGDPVGRVFSDCTEPGDSGSGPYMRSKNHHKCDTFCCAFLPPWPVTHVVEQLTVKRQQSVGAVASLGM